MALSLQTLQALMERHRAFIRKLEILYAEMDSGYAAVADHTAFTCRGCEDNCCLTRFDHHTLIEVLGLYNGYVSLADDQQRPLVRRARAYCRALQHHRRPGEPFRHLCPLNQDTRCLLYAERPMICRLHGIPHVMRHPRKGLITGTGCHIFEASRRPEDGQRLDRTPLYTAMAELERELRRVSGFAGAIRMTVAEMMVCFEEGQDHLGLGQDPGSKRQPRSEEET